MRIFPLGCWPVSALSIPIGEYHNSHAEFNLNHNHVNAATKQASIQTTLRQHRHAAPKQSTVRTCKMYSSHYQSVKKKNVVGHQYFIAVVCDLVVGEGADKHPFLGEGLTW
jgi:hypothetical protein